jgi:trehalose 6-phosphate synthase/phosphatase
MAKARLIVASARLPVTLAHRHDRWEATPSTGGLATALRSVAERRPFAWIGWPGSYVPEDGRKEVRRVLAPHGAAPVFLSKVEIEGFYLGFSNRVVWPLLHNLTERSYYDPEGYAAYRKVNEMFADAIAEQARDGDLIWVHDYQLCLVPQLLRQRKLTCAIGFFLHVPFPSAETYRTLAPREEILRGMLGADFIGFHTYEYVSHFRSACLRVLGVESDFDTVHLPGRNVRLGAQPIGIDPAEIAALCASREARQELAELIGSYPGKRIIVGVDRLDYTKGIPDKLRAFEELLRKNPRWRERAVLIQIAAPSRTGVAEYQRLKCEVDELVGRINGRYGTPSSTPVVYVNQNVPRNRLMGLYQAADVALVTPVRDGMNLVALEYVAARGDRGGTLILSEFAGAAQHLPGARLVNPFDTSQVMSTLLAALEDESVGDLGHMQAFVRENTAIAWANRFLDQLEGTAKEARPSAELLDVSSKKLAPLVRRAERPLVVLDYDGTLRSYVIDPQKAAPEPRTLEVLRRLSELAMVYVVSGRSQTTLESWLGRLRLGLVCEHGLALKPPGGEWLPPAKVSSTALFRLVEPIFEDFVRRTPGSSIERKQAAIAWHYRGVDPELSAFQVPDLLAVVEETLRRRPYSVLLGSRVIEVRHQRVTKGHAMAQILKLHPKSDFLLCAGDDRTDEDLMAAIGGRWRARSITCWVGSKNPHAAYWVESNLALHVELERLAEIWREQRLRQRAPARSDSAGVTLREA